MFCVSVKRILAALIQTYVFWVFALPLLNFELIVVGLFPFLLPFLVGKFIPFFLPPFGMATALTCVGAYLFRGRLTKYRCWLPLGANAIFLVAFIGSVEAYKFILIYADAYRYHPECIHIHSFLRSVREVGEFAPEHAHMVKDNAIFFWSYSERKFVPSDGAQIRGCPK